jgi:hypothetical protein
MKRVLAGIAAGLLSLGLTATPASASSHLFPAQNQNACTAAGGEFERSGPVRTCTVTGPIQTREVILREAGNSGNSWSSTITFYEVTTYTRTGSDRDTDTVSTDLVVVSCTNPGGQLMEPGQGQCPTTL